jgi:hypothetical protein
LEAYAGTRFAQDIWVDVGVFNSHIGYESVTGIDNDMLSRWLPSEFTPYRESGIRVIRETEKLITAAFILNG